MSIWNNLTTPERGSFSLRIEQQTSYGNWSWVKGSDKSVGIALEIQEKIDVSHIVSTKYFDVDSRHIPHIGNVLTIVCRDTEFYEIFEVLCRDLVATATEAHDIREAVGLIGNRVSSWTKLFARGYKGLRQNDIYGLAAELSFLKLWISSDFSEGVEGWTGPKGSAQDFASKIKGKSVEVKARSEAHNIVKISSLEQLDSIGSLYLSVFPISQVKGEGPFETLDSIVDEVLAVLEAQARLHFEQTLLLAGYIRGQYDDYRMKVGDPTFYEISPGFPRLIRANVAIEVISCRYELNLEMCTNFVIKNKELVKAWMS